MASSKPAQRAARRRGELHHARAFGARARRLAALTATGLILTAPPAVAQTTQEGYSSPGGNVQSQVQGPGPANSATAPVGAAQRPQTSITSLPFSGLDIIFLVVAGGGLFLVGVALRRMTQRGDRSQGRTHRPRRLAGADYDP